MSTPTIPIAVALAAQDLFLEVLDLDNESTHNCNLTFEGSNKALTVTIQKEKYSFSEIIYDEDVVLEPSDSRTETVILQDIEQVKTDLKRLKANDYANQHSLERGKEVRHA